VRFSTQSVIPLEALVYQQPAIHQPTTYPCHYGQAPVRPMATHEYQQTQTIKNQVNVKKQTLRLEPVPGQPNLLSIQFAFDASAPCRCSHSGGLVLVQDGLNGRSCLCAFAAQRPAIRIAAAAVCVHSIEIDAARRARQRWHCSCSPCAFACSQPPATPSTLCLHPFRVSTFVLTLEEPKHSCRITTGAAAPVQPPVYYGKGLDQRFPPPGSEATAAAHVINTK
jgi:hypothetical protein